MPSGAEQKAPDDARRAADADRTPPARRWRPSAALQSHTASVALHAGLLGLLLVLTPLAARSIEERIEVEIRTEPPPAPAEPRPKPAPDPPPPKPQPDPPPPRPRRVPPSARQELVKKPRAYAPKQPKADDQPADVPPALQQPKAPRFEIAIDATVEGGSGIEVIAAPRGAVGNVRADPGQRGERGFRGPAPPRTRAPRLQAAPSWQISKLPEPLNSRAFRPDYPPAAKAKGIEGVVIVALEIDDRGRVVSARVARSAAGGIFDRSALAYCRRLRFAPALAGDKAVAARIRWQVDYRYENE